MYKLDCSLNLYFSNFYLLIAHQNSPKTVTVTKMTFNDNYFDLYKIDL